MAADLDLLVVGAGPAGRALSFRAARAGLSVRLVDPDPGRPWRATYGAWTDELPGWIPARVIAARSDTAVVYTPTRRVVERGYCVLDTAALQSMLSDAVPVTIARAATVRRTSVVTDSGEVLTATTVIDARGAARQGNEPRQSAVGVRRKAVDAEMVVMDWRPVAGSSGTFSYRVDLGSGVELVEETCLAGTPPTILARLAQIAAAREGGSRADVTGADAGVELVDFTLAGPPRPWLAADGPLRFGAAGGLMHPATGYSVAATLAAVDGVVEALATGSDPRDALWPRSARAVYELRAAGLSVVLGMDGDDLIAFFDVFFRLPVRHQRAYLSSRDDLAGVVAAMWQVFVGLGWVSRRRLIQGFAVGVAHRAAIRMTPPQR